MLSTKAQIKVPRQRRYFFFFYWHVQGGPVHAMALITTSFLQEVVNEYFNSKP